MGKFMGDGFNSLSFVQRIDDPDNGLLEGKAKGASWMFFIARMTFSMRDYLYFYPLNIRSRFPEKFVQGIRF
jgi:hypothetical protein